MMEKANDKYYSAKDIALFLESQQLKNRVYVLGNGINMAVGMFASGWKGFIGDFAKDLFEDTYSLIEQGIDILIKSNSITAPELYDWLLLKYLELVRDEKEPQKTINKKLKNFILKHSLSFRHNDSLGPIRDYCLKRNYPIITTNFDITLLGMHKEYGATNREEAQIIFPKRIEKKNALSSYFSPKTITNTDDLLHQFAIWHINGIVSYPEGIIMNLRDYEKLGSVVKKRVNIWKRGDNTHDCVSIFLDGDLVFGGISLDSQEIVLRWLLIERKRKYLHHEHAPRAYYIRYHGENESNKDLSKEAYFNDLGIIVLDLAPGEDLTDIFQ